MRVCHLISGDLWAGAEVMAYNLLKYLSRIPDIELTVITLNQQRLAEELKSIGVKIYVVEESEKSFFRIALAIRKIYSKNPHDIIHAHRYKENLLAFTAALGHPDIKIITTQHGLPENINQSRSIVGSLKSKLNFFILSRYFDKVVAVSNDIKEYFINSLGFNSNLVRVIHNGIEIPQILNPVKKDGDFLIGSSGRLFPVKDYNLMTQIANELAYEKDINFTLAGDGPELGSLEKAIVGFTLEGRFNLRGHLDDMDSFYRGLDLYLNTSVHEGIPMTILEAMSRGLPVVAPDVGGIKEIITDGVDGFLIKERDPEKFAEKCLKLKNDKILRERMGNAAREKVIQSFSAQAMAQQYVLLYEELLKG